MVREKSAKLSYINRARICELLEEGFVPTDFIFKNKPENFIPQVYSPARDSKSTGLSKRFDELYEIFQAFKDYEELAKLVGDADS